MQHDGGLTREEAERHALGEHGSAMLAAVAAGACPPQPGRQPLWDRLRAEGWRLGGGR